MCKSVKETQTKSFLKIAKDTIPNKLVTVRPHDKPWYSNVLRCKRREMLKLYGKAKIKMDPQSWLACKHIRNEYFNDIRDAKVTFDESKLQLLINEEKNSKQWWKVLKQVNNCGPANDSIPPLDTAGSVVTDNREKANVFNNFFLEASKLDDANTDIPCARRVLDYNLLTDIVITENEVLDQLSILDSSKSYGPDQVPPKLLKEGRQEIYKSLCRLFNISLESSKVPNLWKKSNVVPIFKKGDASTVSNYRPISLLSVVNKIMERIISKHIYNYLKDNYILTDLESGFQPGRSTTTQLVEVYHEFCKAVQSEKEIRVVFLDISKAFDRVWHEGLLHKLYLSGIDGNLLAWLTDHLKDRQQRVVVGGQHSNWGTITAGVPQGGVLGPLNFLIYINDIVNCVKDVRYASLLMILVSS